MSRLVIPEIKCVESTDTFGRFLAEPLEKGFGTTLGNSLRRVLLGYLPGAAVTWVKIEGTQHEFSTIPHMKEDTLEFLLNVKALRLRSLSGQPGKLTLEMEGEGRVCAADSNTRRGRESHSYGLRFRFSDFLQLPIRSCEAVDTSFHRTHFRIF